MSSTDKITGNYTITTRAGSCGLGDITLVADGGTGNVVVRGNFYVIGTLSNIQTTTTYVTDNYIRLSSEINGQALLHSGILVNRGQEPDAEIRFNEDLNRWEYSVDSITYYPFMGSVEQDPNPSIGGPLDVNCQPIRSTWPCNIVLNPGVQGQTTRGAVELRHVRDNEPLLYKPGSTTLYAKRPISCGDSGLYVADVNNVSGQELVTKRKATVMSLVL